MAVNIDAKRSPLAGSGSINTTGGASENAEMPLVDSGDAGGQDGASEGRSVWSASRMPGRDRLAWVCDRCTRRIAGAGAGFAAVDLRETDAAAKGLLRCDGVAVKARWGTYHAKCFPEALRPLNPFFRIWLDRVGSVDDLLDAVAELSRLPWFGWSDWGGSLVRKVLADTGKTIDDSVALREQRAQRRRKNAREHKRLPPEDERCGSDRGYHAGCGCQRCRAAHNEVARRNKENQRRRRAEAKS
jgi:hypothetical protein